MKKVQLLLQQARSVLESELRNIDIALAALGSLSARTASASSGQGPAKAERKRRSARIGKASKLAKSAAFSVGEIDSFLRHRTFPDFLLRSRRLPQIVSSIEISNLHLRPDAEQCLAGLKGRNGAMRAADFSHMEVARLLQIPGFDNSTLADLLSKLRPFMPEHRPQLAAISPTLSRVLQQFGESPVARRIFCDDPRFSKVVTPCFAIANGHRESSVENETLSQLILGLATTPLSSDEEGTVWASGRAIQKEIDGAMHLSLESELHSLLRSSLDDVTTRILCRVHGFDGQGGRSFEQAGKEFDLTRDQVRRTCRRAAVFSDRKPFLPTLEECVKVMSLKQPLADHEIERLLQERKLTERPFKLAGVRKAAELFRGLGYTANLPSQL